VTTIQGLNVSVVQPPTCFTYALESSASYKTIIVRYTSVLTQF